jgi:hypothetical protein
MFPLQVPGQGPRGMRTVPVMGNGGITNGHHPENGHVANGAGGGGGKAEKVLLTGYDLKVPRVRYRT